MFTVAIFALKTSRYLILLLEYWCVIYKANKNDVMVLTDILPNGIANDSFISGHSLKPEFEKL